ncbi:hypothetical protein BDK51DRAFT_42272 [Blyttiomyces helicus]|uniref:Uncharacterized protein n=1 Tax=Blyttiomyces helicus TaxID=388810 RepID=A0A4P9WM88_9FUNG|nr:hypothetical protein BDK51DRAFT_42272 [Blyttiomyces helicus]|eukprot:RKO94179.1 hypothetical protein BDK51DRAFT_42272 [Blyttiomyces helicus]
MLAVWECCHNGRFSCAGMSQQRTTACGQNHLLRPIFAAHGGESRQGGGGDDAHLACADDAEVEGCSELGEIDLVVHGGDAGDRWTTLPTGIDFPAIKEDPGANDGQCVEDDLLRNGWCVSKTSVDWIAGDIDAEEWGENHSPDDDIVESNPEKPWDYAFLSMNPNIIMDLVKDPEKPWDYLWLSQTPNFKIEMANVHQDKPWNHYRLSLSLNISMEFMNANAGKTWNFQYLSMNPNILIEMVNA